MKRLSCVTFLLILVLSCNSIKKYNEQIATLHAVEDLQNDVDKLYKQLKKHHPKLYQYTSKSDLDFKFDSLKTAIKQPLTTQEFYKQVAPVVANVRQGHVSVGYTPKRFTKKEIKILNKQKFEFYDLDFQYLENKLWVENNYGKDSTLVGSEVVGIDGEPVSKLINTYKTRFASDGFNATLHNRYVGKGFASFYIRDRGFLDSLKVTFKNNDSIFTRNFKRLPKDEKMKDSSSGKEENANPKKLTKEDKKESRQAKRKNRKDNKKYGYLSKIKKYTRNLNFIGKDSTVAYMKIRSFTNGAYKKFYEESFVKIDSAKANYLILDLRDNGGGRIAEIDYLYSFLTDKNYQFIADSEVNSRFPFLKSFMSNTTPLSLKILGGIFAPIIMTHNMLKTNKTNDKLYYRFKKHTKVKAPNPLGFKGTLYVLINGNSFSASSLISTHLKANEEAIFVGEETGGAYNGTVAGIYKIYELPTSKIKIRMGLMQIEAPQKQLPDGFGIKPDIKITPIAHDLKLKRDTELEWVLNAIYK